MKILDKTKNLFAMTEERKLYGDILMINQGGYIIEFINLKNNASFCIVMSGVQYYDPFGNSMVSYPTAISVNKKIYSLKKFTDEVRISTGIAVLLRENEIKEIANKTFYLEEQFRSIDFVTLTITEEK